MALKERGFGPYIVVNTVIIPITENKQINITNYISERSSKTSGIANINLSGNWQNCKLIIGTQLITQIDTHMCTFDIGAIPYCKLQNYYLDVQVTGNTIITFDNIEFETPIIFTNSNIYNPESYYVTKITTWITCDTCNKDNNIHNFESSVNYLRFMSDCAGLAF